MVSANNKTRFYFVGGINGSGKSTILKELTKTEKKVKIIHGSVYFMRWLGLKNGDYNTLRSLDDVFVLKELDKMMNFLIKNPSFDANLIIFNAHYLNIRYGKAIKWIGDWMRLMDGLFLIKSNPQIILQRLNNDLKKTKRDRNLFSQNANYVKKIKFLSFCNNKSEIIIKKLSKNFNIPYFIINNKDILKTIRSFKKHIKGLEV